MRTVLSARLGEMVQKGVGQMSNRVTVEEQIERGVLRASNPKYVPARVETQAITHRPTVEVMPPQNNLSNGFYLPDH